MEQAGEDSGAWLGSFHLGKVQDQSHVAKEQEGYPPGWEDKQALGSRQVQRTAGELWPPSGQVTTGKLWSPEWTRDRT